MVTDRLVKKMRELTPISDESIQNLLLCAKQEELLKGDCLLGEGKICNHLYFVERGFLKVCTDHDGKEININFIFEGSFTSDLKSLKKQEPSPFSIKAGERTVVTSFTKEDLWERYSRVPEIERLCMRILGNFLIEQSECIAFQKLASPADKYRYLIEHNPRMIQRLSVSQLSSYIGVARETLSRIRRKSRLRFL
jgi:CRP-like cAMP-binding protein